MRLSCLPQLLDKELSSVRKRGDKHTLVGISAFGNPASMHADFNELIIYRGYIDNLAGFRPERHLQVSKSRSISRKQKDALPGSMYSR